MTIGIYGIFSASDNTCLYIGRSIDIESRWRTHLSKLSNATHLSSFVKWYKANGSDVTSLNFVILEVLSTDEEIHRREAEWFSLLKPLFYGQIPSGESTWYSGIIFNDEVKAKISDSLKKHAKENPKAAPYGKDSKGRILKEITCAYSLCGKKHYVADSRIRFCSHECGAKNQFNIKENVSKDMLAKALQEPTTYTELSKQFGISRPTVKKYIDKYGLKDQLTLIDSHDKIICDSCSISFSRNTAPLHKCFFTKVEARKIIQDNNFKSKNECYRFLSAYFNCSEGKARKLFEKFNLSLAVTYK